MDRQIVYPGSIPLDTDLLNIQRNIITGMGALARAILGETGVVDGMACVAGPGSYTVTVDSGSYTAPQQLDFTAFGSLAADPAMIVRTALHPGQTRLQLSPPSDPSTVVCWLVQASIAESDAGALALPYWNAANPSIPFSGPQNSGASQHTQRQLRVVVRAKPNAPQPYPIGTPPAADAGWVGLYAVTTFAGKPGIAPTDIVPIAGAPMLRYTLPILPPGRIAQEVHTVDAVWRAPQGVRWARVRVVGAGGGGGGGDSNYSGGGGGAGGYAEGIVQVVPGESYAITIGQGGAGNIAGQTGRAGGDTAFGGLVRASGGKGGGSANPNSYGGAPGAGVSGSLLQAGGYGGDGALITNIPGGNGGASAFGGGGRSANPGGAPTVGLARGSGGGGAYGTQSAGGAGAPGLVMIEH